MAGSEAPLLPDPARAAILAWWDANGRRLAFRETRDPYAILVSEAMAQQTQIGRASERWVRFLQRFPTVGALAASSPADVLREWRGLGYNRRALSLWRAARAIVDDHGGEVPRDVTALEGLPGVGPYTARAVAAIAFGLPVGAVDTNVRRVLGRVTAGRRSLGAREMQAVADAAVPVDRPGDWTHALMDVGATFCRPAPRCDGCPVRAWCAWAGEPAAAAVTQAGRNSRSPAFTSTSRWLRGRLLDRLRDGAGDGWIALHGPIGAHDARAVETALAGLASDGLLERHPVDPARCRLPLG
jgi:A/G-specific adenine glycosylase